jgi:putative spermidine/putrescine transport system permease protein
MMREADPAIAPIPIRVWRQVALPLLLCLPGLLLLTVFFLVPLGRLFLLSVYAHPQTAALSGNVTLANYAKFLGDSFYLELLLRTLKLSAITTLVTLLLGYSIAMHFVSATPRTRAYVTLIILAPLMVSVIVRTYGWLIILGPTGLVNTVLETLHLTQAPVRLLFTEVAVIIGLTHIFLPYMTLAIVSSLQTIDPVLPLAAKNLGASETRAFVRVVLPLSLPGVLAGSLLVFSLSNSAFATPALLGGPGAQVLSLLTYQQNLVLLNWNFGAAIAVILLVVVVTGVMLYSRAMEGGRFKGVFQ